jgi:dUTPase
MKIYVKKIFDNNGKLLTVLPFRAVKKNEQGEVVKTNAAAYDVISLSDPKIVGVKITPVGFETNEVGNEWASVDYIEYETGLYVQPSTQSHHLLLHPRSSNSKYNLVLSNSIGLIDNDYRGQICVRFKYVWQPEDMWWSGNENRKSIFGSVNMSKIYKKGDVVCQILCENTTSVEWELVDELNQTVRGEGGWGHTTPISDTKPILGYNPNSVPPIIDRMKKLPGIVDKYNELGGVVVKEKYTEELKKRNQE